MGNLMSVLFRILCCCLVLLVCFFPALFCWYFYVAPVLPIADGLDWESAEVLSLISVDSIEDWPDLYRIVGSVGVLAGAVITTFWYFFAYFVCWCVRKIYNWMPVGYEIKT